MITLFLVPAYGRTYKTKSAVLKDWADGKDFIRVVPGSGLGPYCNIEEVPDLKRRGYLGAEFHEGNKLLAYLRF